MDAEQINAAVAERVGWCKWHMPNHYTGQFDPCWKEKAVAVHEPDIIHEPDCFTTASAEWCEHVLKPVLADGYDLFGDGDLWRYSVTKDGFGTDDPDLYTAVALAYLKMTEE